MEKSVFETLSELNLNDKLDKKDKEKNKLSYLPWAWAWSEVKKLYPSASYKALETVFDEVLGFMCYTEVTIEGETLTMWLPVMDGSNKAMKKTPYTYKTKFGEKTVEAATMFDINKTIMRCLVKNLAMFGLGIYIYAKEEFPQAEVEALQRAEEEVRQQEEEAKKPKPLELNTPEWDKVKLYVEDNKSMGKEKIFKQIQRRYTLSKEIKTEITSLLA